MKPTILNIYIYIFFFSMWKKKKFKKSASTELTKTWMSVPTWPDWAVSVNPYSYTCLLLWIVLQPWFTGTTARLSPPLWCSLFGRCKSTGDSNNWDETSHFFCSHFRCDTIKAMASMGKWIDATYIALLRCWYICDDFKSLKAEHLILRGFLSL